MTLLKIDLGEFEREDYTPDQTSDYILDVTKTSSYQNQTEEYYQEYGKWRSKEKNPFGYSYVKDVREHTYVDGKGFVSDGPDKAERKSLIACFNFIGLLLIISQIFSFLENIIISKLTNVSLYSTDFFQDATSIENVSFSVVAVSSVINVLKLAVPAGLFFLITKFPKKVAFPKPKKPDYKMSISGVSFILMATMLCRAANITLNLFTEKFGINFSNVDFIDTMDLKSIILYCFCEYFLVGILTEILFRGIILQFFRQFGDLFAIIISCIANVVFCADISQLGAVALTSVVLALFTIRTGSILTPIFMRLASRIVEMIATIGASTVSGDVKILVESALALAIISFALVAYSRIISSQMINFNVSDSYTHLSMKEKFVLMISSGPVVVWLVVALVSIIFSVRFV